MRRALWVLVLTFFATFGCRRKSSSTESPSAGGSTAASSTTGETSPAIARFWKWFSAHASDLRDSPDLQQSMLTIGDEIGKVEKGVFAEIEKGDPDPTLVITADGDRRLFPVVKQIHAARPAVLGWKIVAFRQRMDPGSSFAIEMDGKKLDPATMKVVAQKEGDRLAIVVYVPGFTRLEDYGPAPYVVLDHVVGEYDMETKIGAIDWASTDDAPANARPLTTLPATVDETFPPSP